MSNASTTRAPSPLNKYNPGSDAQLHSRRHSLPDGKPLVFRRLFKASTKHHVQSPSMPTPLDTARASTSSSSLSYSPSSSSLASTSSTPTSLSSHYSTSSDKEYPPSQSSSNGSLARLGRSFSLRPKHRRVGDDLPTLPSTTHNDKPKTSNTPLTTHPLEVTSAKPSQIPSNELPQKKPNKLQKWQSKSAKKIKSWLHLPHTKHSHKDQTPRKHHVEIQGQKPSQVHNPPTDSDETPKALEAVEFNLNTPIESSPTSKQLKLTNVERLRSVQKYRLNYYRRRSDRSISKDGIPRIPKRSSSLPKSFSPCSNILRERHYINAMESESLIQDGGSSQIKEINQQPHNIIETIILKDDDQSEGAVTLAANHDLETLLFAASLPLPCSNPASPTSETFFSTVTPRDLEQPNHSVSIDEQPSCSVVVVPTIAQEDQLIELPEVTQPSTEYVKRTELSLELSDRIEDLVPNNGELVREDLYQSSPGGEVAPTSVCVEDIPDLLEFAEQTGCIDELSLYNQQAELLDSEGLQIQLENHNNDANLDFINKIHSNLSSKIEVVNNLAISEPEEKEEEKETVDQESVPDINQISIEAFVTSLEPPHVLITLPPLPLSESLLEDPLSKCCNLTESTSSQGLVVETLYQMYPFAMKRWHCQPKLSILTAASFWSTYRVLETKNDL